MEEEIKDLKCDKCGTENLLYYEEISLLRCQKCGFQCTVEYYMHKKYYSEADPKNLREVAIGSKCDCDIAKSDKKKEIKEMDTASLSTLINCTFYAKVVGEETMLTIGSLDSMVNRLNSITLEGLERLCFMKEVCGVRSYLTDSELEMLWDEADYRRNITFKHTF